MDANVDLYMLQPVPPAHSEVKRKGNPQEAACESPDSAVFSDCMQLITSRCTCWPWPPRGFGCVGKGLHAYDTFSYIIPNAGQNRCCCGVIYWAPRETRCPWFDWTES